MPLTCLGRGRRRPQAQLATWGERLTLLCRRRGGLYQSLPVVDRDQSPLGVEPEMAPCRALGLPVGDKRVVFVNSGQGELAAEGGLHPGAL